MEALREDERISRVLANLAGEVGVEQREPILVEREKTHGDFKHQGAFAQQLKDLYRASPNWNIMSGAQREALDLDATKTSRIRFGDFLEEEHWKNKAEY